MKWKRANPLAPLKFLTRHPRDWRACTRDFLIYLGSRVFRATGTFSPFTALAGAEKMVGISLAVVGVLVGGVQAGLTRVINQDWAMKKSIYIGLSLLPLGLILLHCHKKLDDVRLSYPPIVLEALPGPPPIGSVCACTTKPTR